MSRLERLLGKPKEFEIGGEKLMIHPLTLGHIDLMMNAGNEEKQASAIKEILTITLKKSVPEATDEEIENLGMEHFETLFSAIAEVNKLGDKDAPTSKIKERLKQIQDTKK